jgi:hypothetical protein
MNLDLTHSLYKYVDNMRRTSRDLLAGSHAVKAGAEAYLLKTANETAAGYEFRLRRAVYENWGSVVVMTRMAMLWLQNPSRKLGPLDEFANDINNNGMSIDEFFKQVENDAAIDGMRWVLANKTSANVALVDGKQYAFKDGVSYPYPLSLEAEKELGIRPFFESIPAIDIIDWKAESGKLEWVVQRVQREEKTLPGEESTKVNQRVVWTKTEWITYEFDADKGDWYEVSRGVHGLGEVPLIPFYGFKECEFLGYPVIKDVIDHILSIYNKMSDRDFSEYLTNNPIPYVIGGQHYAAIDISYGNGMFLDSTMGNTHSIGYLEPSGKGVDQSRTSERDLIRRISEICLRQAKPYSAQVQSEDSLKAESYVYNSSLTSVATSYEVAEMHCLKLMAKWQGIETDIEVKYNKSFDYNLLEAAMVSELSKMQEKRQLSLRTLLTILQERGVLPKTLDIEKEINDIESDIETDAMPGFSTHTGGVIPDKTTPTSGTNSEE